MSEFNSDALTHTASTVVHNRRSNGNASVPRAISGGDRGGRPLWSPPSWARGAMPSERGGEGASAAGGVVAARRSSLSIPSSQAIRPIAW